MTFLKLSTDFSVTLEGVELGVSVTRAISNPTSPFALDDAVRLLRKKLHGVVKSTAACFNADWRKQILHIWARSEKVAHLVEQAYALIEPELVADTLCFVTRCSALPELFDEKATPRKAAQRLKGAKDAEHLRILQESDPTRSNRCVAYCTTQT